MPFAVPSARRLLLDTGLDLLEKQGFHDVSIADIAAAAGQPLAEAYRYFGSKNDFVLGLYQRIHNELEASAPDLPTGPIALRFQVLVRQKLTLLAPHRRLLRSQMATLLDAEAPTGVLSPETESIRLRGLALFEVVVNGATDAPAEALTAQLAQALYAAHWGVLGLRLLDRSADGQATDNLLEMLSAGLAMTTPQLSTLFGPLLLGQVSTAIGQFLEVAPEVDFDVARRVAKLLMLHRKVLRTGPDDPAAPDEQSIALQLPKLHYYIRQGLAIHLILPAFPAKSPNPHKVLGKLPDLGEEIALTFLQSLCDDIRQVYAPGARISVCADGRVFADLVQVSDADVSAYNEVLKQQLRQLGTTDVAVVNLEDLLATTSFDEARTWVVAHYGEPLNELKARVRDTAHHRALFNGIHRFVSEDGLALAPEKSKNRVKEESKEVAYEVIRRSNAWTRLLAQEFPHAVRLSIHPQHPHSDKIGLRITRAVDDWLTPWHGVVVLRDNDYVLMKRHQAEELGAELVEKDGRPSHFVAGPNS
ncbi:L-tyrosine/L-tryptophan isonitrile synthase family protein [Hymenobacter sp. BT683]|uniref:L-tyrosine/L-tryptophan isonitrile synthase family protein n=1 Tax=Hymenobacter jeongseonensis TaxID=2791027 RepID=A0ABS0IJL0_9BACT|nr:L-tyrosine/L-tryptophan isonitrile synthase family protein [Hymenobacter jeongseonensis]MBF9238058.1 L-tyrosine/L-tryptophan isonitrile synthase family protein [Hymenobacter jeongseonensis]